MRTRPVSQVARACSCCLLLSWPFLAQPQIPQALGKLQMTSAQPGASITINGSHRQERTPVTLAVAPGDYRVAIGNCAEQTIHVSAGETRNVDCRG